VRFLIAAALLSSLAFADDPDIAATLEKIRKGSPSECVEALGKESFAITDKASWVAWWNKRKAEKAGR